MRKAKPRDSYYKSADGLQLFYREYKSKPGNKVDPVICLPGLTRNSLDFDEIAERLAKKRRVITTDLRGRGRSEHAADRATYNPSQYVDDIWALLDYLRLPRVAVIGTSLGGWMAMLMAHTRPAAVSAVVMNDIGPEVDPVGIGRILASAGTLPAVANWDEAVIHISKHYEPAFPNWTTEQWLRFAKKTYQEVEGGGLDIRLDRNVGIASREGLSGLQGDPWQFFSALEAVPSLVLRGDRSDILSNSTLSKMRMRKPDLKTLIVGNRGHAPNLDEPEAIDAIEEFLREF